MGLNAGGSASQALGTAGEQWQPVARRVGVFGGAFDPPHVAHRELAEAALVQLGLDALHILPTGQAWHKARVLTPAVHRLAMCECAFGDLEKAHIDPRETLRDGPTYTADTLIELAQENPGAELYLVLGADQLLAFKTWKRWSEVLDLARLAVAQRPNAAEAEAGVAAPATDLSSVGVPFVPLAMPLHNISATAIRARASTANGLGPDFERLVSDDVASYISSHSLYQDPS